MLALAACGGGGADTPPLPEQPQPPHAVAVADGSGTAARFKDIKGFAVDKVGNYYVADSGNCVIRKITPAKVVSTLAGVIGDCGHADGAGAAARFQSIVAITSDAAGNLYIADLATVRKVSLDGVVTTLAGKQVTSAVKVDGIGADASFVNLQGITADSAGNLLVSDGRQYAAHRENIDGEPIRNALRQITPQGAVTTLPNTEGSCFDAVVLACAGDLQFDGAGNLYLTSSMSLVKRSAAGAANYIRNSAGNTAGSGSFSGHESLRLTPDDAGNVFYTAWGDVYKVRPDGEFGKVVNKSVVTGTIVPDPLLTPDLPVEYISAVTYIGGGRFLASFDHAVVILTLK